MTTNVMLRALGLTCMAVAVGFVSGRVAFSHYGMTLTGALIALPIVLYAFPRPFVALSLLVLMLGTTVAYNVVPRVNLPGHPPLTWADGLLGICVIGMLWRKPLSHWPPAARRTGAFLAFLLVIALVPTVRMFAHGHTAFREAVLGYKTLFYMTVAVVIAVEFSGVFWHRLLDALIGLSAVVSVLSLASAASGTVSSFVTRLDPVAIFAASTATSGTARIRLAGLFLVYAMSIPTVALILTVKDRRRSWRIGAFVLMICAIAVSLNRNMYLGGAAGIIVAVAVGGPRLRHRFTIAAAAVVACGVLFIQAGAVPGVAAKVGSRASSALSSKVLTTGSAQARVDEFSHALNSISRHPWYGVGWFQPYGSFAFTTPRAGVENFYLHIATDLGIPVALAFLAFCLQLVGYGLRRAQAAADPADRALLAALVGAVVALMLSALVGTYLQDPNSSVIFGLTCGLMLAAGIRAVPRGGSAVTPGAELAASPEPA